MLPRCEVANTSVTHSSIARVEFTSKGQQQTTGRAVSFLDALTVVCIWLTLAFLAHASQPPQIDPSSAALVVAQGKRVHIPRISQAPKLEDFADMMPHGAAAEMAEITGFIQRTPTDGAPATQDTRVYLAYDSNSLYIVWLCFDTQPRAVRANRARRENIYNDDYVLLILDTFQDQRHGLVFGSNPLGIQEDGLWTAGAGSNPDDT